MPPSPLNPATTRNRRPSPSVSVVIPVRDPGGLPLMLRGLPPVDEVIVVGDGPTTETAAVVRTARPDARVLRPGRPGAGNALATGLAAATCDVVITLNGDGSTDPGEIPAYVAALTGGADVALGSRYRDGGRDLTGGRFRRWANLALVWVLNKLFGTERTDPGFGYAAFWRDALDRLDLPDPSARAAAGWTDGPELGPLLALRPWLRGLRVTEIGSVAYPRMGRPARAETPTPSHWLRLVAWELRARRGRHSPAVPELPGTSGWTRSAGSALPGRAGSTPGDTGSPASAPPGRAGSTRGDGSGSRGLSRRGGSTGARSFTDRTGSTPGDVSEVRPSTHAGLTAMASATGPSATSGPASSTGRASTGGPGDGPTDPAVSAEWHRSDRRPEGEPMWGPGRRRPSPARDLWRTGDIREPHTTPRSIANVTPHAWSPGHSGLVDAPDPEPSAEHERPWRYPLPDADGPRAAIPPRREVGGKRRRIEGHGRPDLRVIKGEGDGTGSRTKSGRLRPVPKENLGN